MICIIHTWQVKEELQHAGNTDACSSDQTFSRGLIKTQHNLDHLKKSDVHGSQAIIPSGKHYSHR